MALKYAGKTGNWSDATVWNGGTLPVAGDIVLSNTYTVTIDQNVDLTTGIPAAAAGPFTVGTLYRIVDLGNTNFTAIGAVANIVGVMFVATGVGTGSGTAITCPYIGNHANTSPAVTAGGKFVVGVTRTLNLNIWTSATSASSPVLEIQAGAVITFNGGLLGNAVYTGASQGISPLGSCTLTINGCVVGGANVTSSAGSSGVIYSAAATGLLTCTVNGLVLSGNSAYGVCFNLASPAELAVIGNVYSRALTNTYGTINISSPSAVTVTGNVYAGMASLATATAVYFQATASGSTYNQTGNIYCGYGGGVQSVGALLTLHLTGDIVGSAAGGVSYYGVALTAAVGSYITGDVTSGVNTSAISIGGSCTLSGTYRKADGSGKLLHITGSAATLDMSAAVFSYIGTGSTAEVIYVNGVTANFAVPHGITQKGANAFLYLAGAGTVSVTGDVRNEGTSYGIYAAPLYEHHLTVTGNITSAATSAVASAYLDGTLASTFVIIGNVTGGSAAGGSFGVSHYAGILSITGSVTGGSSGTTPYGLNANGSAVTSTSIIAGNVSAGSTAAAHGIYARLPLVADSIEVQGTVTATAYGCGVMTPESTGLGKFILKGNTYDHATNAAIVTRRIAYGPDITLHVWDVNGQAATFNPSGTWTSLAGYVPSAAENALAVRAELAAELARVSNCATVATTGDQLTTFMDAP